MQLRFLTRSAVVGLTLLIVAAFAAQLVSEEVTLQGMFIPQLAFKQPWRWVTSAFLHGGLIHIFFNLWALFFFGMALENQIGPRKILLLFFGGAIAGDLGYLATGGTGPALGASGAIYALMGALAILQPRLQIVMWPLFFPMPLIAAIFVWVALNVFYIYGDSPIAGGAHLGGLVLGLWAGFYLRRPRRAPGGAPERVVVAPGVSVRAPPQEGARFECANCGYVATHFSEVESPRCPGCGEPSRWRSL